MRTLFATFLALTTCSVILAQTPTITIQNAVLRLGMTEAEVAAEVGKQTALVVTKNGGIANQASDEANTKNLRLYGIVRFTKGHLSYVDKFWRNEDSPDTAIVIMNALFGAATSVAGNGRTCTVSTWTGMEPDQDYKETSIECELPTARRSIHAFIKTFHYERDLHSIQISEVLESKVLGP